MKPTDFNLEISLIYAIDFDFVANPLIPSFTSSFPTFIHDGPVSLLSHVFLPHLLIT